MSLLYSYLATIINFKAKFFLSSYISFALVYAHFPLVSLLEETTISLTLLVKIINNLGALVAIEL